MHVHTNKQHKIYTNIHIMSLRNVVDYHVYTHMQVTHRQSQSHEALHGVVVFVNPVNTHTHNDVHKQP